MSRVCCDRTWGDVFKLQECRFRLDIRNKFINNEGDRTLEQVTQSNNRCPIHEGLHGQVGWDSELPDLFKGVPAHCRAVELNDF